MSTISRTPSPHRIIPAISPPKSFPKMSHLTPQITPLYVFFCPHMYYRKQPYQKTPFRCVPLRKWLHFVELCFFHSTMIFTPEGRVSSLSLSSLLAITLLPCTASPQLPRRLGGGVELDKVHLHRRCLAAPVWWCFQVFPNGHLCWWQYKATMRVYVHLTPLMTSCRWRSGGSYCTIHSLVESRRLHLS